MERTRRSRPADWGPPGTCRYPIPSAANSRICEAAVVRREALRGSGRPLSNATVISLSWSSLTCGDRFSKLVLPVIPSGLVLSTLSDLLPIDSLLCGLSDENTCSRRVPWARVPMGRVVRPRHMAWPRHVRERVSPWAGLPVSLWALLTFGGGSQHLRQGSPHLRGGGGAIEHIEQELDSKRRWDRRPLTF